MAKLLSGLVPLVILACVLGIAALHFKGIINVSGFLNPNDQNYLNLHYVTHPTTGPKDQNPIGYNMPQGAGATTDKTEPNLDCDGYTILDAEDGEVGQKYEASMKATINGETSKSPFKFYVFDSIAEAAFPPGIKLYPEGTLKGVPTKAGPFEFEVCAENTEGDGDCFCVRLFVKAKTTTTTISPNCPPCPSQSCDTGNCCCETNNGILTVAVLTYDCCTRCPGDTHEVGKDVIAPGGPYKICQCNSC